MSYKLKLEYNKFIETIKLECWNDSNANQFMYFLENLKLDVDIYITNKYKNTIFDHVMNDIELYNKKLTELDKLPDNLDQINFTIAC